jgi:hypothetical protein
MNQHAFMAGHSHHFIGGPTGYALGGLVPIENAAI